MFVIENLRLKELVAVARQNKGFFDAFVTHLVSCGYSDLFEFIQDDDDKRAFTVLYSYLTQSSSMGVVLYDGISRPYDDAKARWLFLGWIFRDAPEQRLKPLVRSLPGRNVNEKRAYLFNELRKYTKVIYPDRVSWDWVVIQEIMVDRLEGSRRAIKGTLFEIIVRRLLTALFGKFGLRLKVTDREVKIGGETYDVEVIGSRGTILLPVKTRETMGGGHAMLFTRDIHKSIQVAFDAGNICLPIVIAESWGGDLTELACEHYIYIQMNPNQIAELEPVLRDELEKLVQVFRSIQ